MNIKNILKISFGMVALAATQISCINDDKWDAPEITCTNKWDAPTTTMAEIVAKAPSSTTGSGAAYTFPDEDASNPAIIFDGYVVSSDQGGNFYKTISFQDSPTNPTVGLVVGINKSMNYTDFPVGSHIRIKVNGMKIGKSNGVITLGVEDPDYTIGRIPESIISRYISGVCNGNGLEVVDIVPTEVTIAQLTGSDAYLNTLVKVKNVQFNDEEIGLGLLDTDESGAYVDTDRNIVDDEGNTTIVRTDGYFKDTSYEIPNSKGDITFVASKYLSSTATTTYTDNYQNVIRGISDLDLTEELPSRKLLVEGFGNSNFTTNSWTTESVIGSQEWGITTFGNPKPSAYMRGYDSVTQTNKANEDWLISKEISLSNLGDYSNSVYFSFETDARYPGNTLEVYITDNYTGDYSTTTWTKLNPTLDTDLNSFGGFISSGKLDLAAYLNKNIRVAFKYTSTTSAASTWEVDNVKIIGEK